DLNLGDHVFPSKKYRLIHDRLLEEGFAEPSDFVRPEPASDEDLLRVHGERWVEGLKHNKLDYLELLKLEIPYSREMVEAFWLAAGGSILAARLALRDGIGFNIGGGFHHAFPNHGEGFCAIHDVAVAIRKMQAEKLVERVMVVDTDVHHGNGTAAIFAKDPLVFTLSIHQLNNYPSEKPPSTIDIHLPAGTGDDEYLQLLEKACRKGMREFRPQLVMYVAGADPYREDQLGGLSLTLDGLKQRDRLVFDLARERDAAVAVALAGGYAMNLDDTVTIHCNTAHAAAESLMQNYERKLP
ncbi:MAG TPA: histone deacetylase, partial [Bryobacteraceae bacterium]|nr:histone deacetylase [Bryobacteraceae bacterium]